MNLCIACQVFRCLLAALRTVCRGNVIRLLEPPLNTELNVAQRETCVSACLHRAINHYTAITVEEPGEEYIGGEAAGLIIY